MIDEFQDNNALQRDLIYLLAEKASRTGKGLAAPKDLDSNRMFFVGDEKQSIYRFRGADVAVFRELDRTMADLLGRQGEGSIELIHNYRSRPGLIAAFNYIFNGVFKEGELGTEKERADYEAVYNNAVPPEKSAEESQDNLTEKKPLLHFCFLNSEDLKKDDEGLGSHDLEAVFIAGRIRDMVYKKEKIPKKTPSGIMWEECTWGDFAVLERSYTHQSKLEKHFREFGVLYSSERPSGLFSDAPILDLFSYLKLLVYPEDRLSYAALIRSPFMRLSDLSLSACMLALDMPGDNKEPFAEENEKLIPKADLELYRLARERYRYYREASRSLSITELVTKLWFEEGYRYETLWTETAQVYESLFDLFFSLASDAELKGKSLSEFVEYLEDVMNRGEKPEEKDIPGEGENGVRIMSIHKCKGLEFPVVFIFDCAHSGNSSNSSELISFHEKFGLILNIPQADELPAGGNYFRKIFADEERAKDFAELKRLLYVAMTRAENRLFLTFSLPPQNQNEKKDWDLSALEFNKETIFKRLLQIDEKEGVSETFLTLLAGLIPACPPSLCRVETIPVLTRSEISGLAAGGEGDSSISRRSAGRAFKSKSLFQRQREAALAAAPFYENAALLPEGKAGPLYLTASELCYKPREGGGDTLPSDDEFFVTLEKTGLKAAEAGSLVHAVLEGRLKGQPPVMPPKIRDRLEDKAIEKLMLLAAQMADGFLCSSLGKRWAAAGLKEAEYPIVTSVTIGGKAIAILGKIDLLFEEENEVAVVDFKTDRIENPEDHFAQLAVYLRAAEDIFRKPASTWLYYLRSGREIDTTMEVRFLSLEELAAQPK
jgi:ATP-dependent helicase/nuclease subunit A